MDYGKLGDCLEGRLYAIRKDQKLNQEEFGKRLGVTRSAICNYEGGTRPIGEQIILAVCREFSVNALWMRKGIGTPYNPSPNGVIDKLISEYKCSKFEGDFLKTYFQMSEEERANFVLCAYRLFSPLIKGMQGRNPFAGYFDATSYGEDEIDKINREVEQFRAQLTHERLMKTGTNEDVLNAGTHSGVTETEATHESSSGFAPHISKPATAEQEQFQPEQQKMPTPVSEDGQDDLEEFVRKHKKNLTAGQEQQILKMMQAMITSQKQPQSVSAQKTVDETSPKKGRPGNP